MRAHDLQGVYTALDMQSLPEQNPSLGWSALQRGVLRQSSSMLPDFLLFGIKTAVLEMIEHFALAQEKWKEREAGGRIRGIK